MSFAKKRRRAKPLEVVRLPVTFTSDNRRVITRFFDVGGVARVQRVVQRVNALDNDEVARILRLVFQGFGSRHSDIASVFVQNYRSALSMIGLEHEPITERQLLIGSYFTLEYSIESAALFNPSIVPHPDQANTPKGAIRFIMSLRATGEGHVSSIVFRTGVIHGDHRIEMDPPSQFSHKIGVQPDKRYDKRLFQLKLADIQVPTSVSDRVLGPLNDAFTMADLEHSIAIVSEPAEGNLQAAKDLEGIRWVARSNYQLKLSDKAEPSEMVIFPQTTNESRGIEDLRMVRFVDDDGTVTYYGTCTAFDGFRILPELIETSDFLTIGVHTLNGACALNKGMALFPRRINGHYVMCSRIDGENLFIAYSDIIHFWENAELLKVPIKPWEFVQIGNCGSPLETEKGWLLLTHGVGPMRTYCIGAMLLDLDNPLTVIGTLSEPLISPMEEERDGYVPNVAYTCGSMIHNGQVYIPFATSDTSTRFAMVSLDSLLDRLLNG